MTPCSLIGRYDLEKNSVSIFTKLRLYLESPTQFVLFVHIVRMKLRYDHGCVTVSSQCRAVVLSACAASSVRCAAKLCTLYRMSHRNLMFFEIIAH